jgi:D-proline reductase (dithiol) PrdB
VASKFVCQSSENAYLSSHLWAVYHSCPIASGHDRAIRGRSILTIRRTIIDAKTAKDQLIAKLFTHFPFLFQRWVRNHKFVEFDDSPWTPLTTRISESRVALVTTAGVHLKSEAPYNMRDPSGDPTFRSIPGDANPADLAITHNYFPLERLRDLARAGEIGSVASRHFSFMGHILPPHIHTLMHRTAPEVARLLGQDAVDLVLLTPA